MSLLYKPLVEVGQHGGCCVWQCLAQRLFPVSPLNPLTGPVVLSQQGFFLEASCQPRGWLHVCEDRTATLMWMTQSLNTGLAPLVQPELECVPSKGHCYDNVINNITF